MAAAGLREKKVGRVWPLPGFIFGLSCGGGKCFPPPSTWITESAGNTLSAVIAPADRAGTSSAGELTRSRRLFANLLRCPRDVTCTATPALSRTVEPSIVTPSACT